MKKVINGKIYNSDTAKQLFSQSVSNNGNYVGSNDLLVSPRGNLFIYYFSNGQDGYRRSDIQAVTAQEAKDWLSGREIDDKELEALSQYLDLEEA